MTSQEEWRKISYERSVGESGNNSMGTMANQRGYDSYLAKQNADFYSRIQSATTPTTNTSRGFTQPTYAPGSLQPQWVPRWVNWVLALLGAIIMYQYISYSTGGSDIKSSEIFFNYYAWPMGGGFTAGLVCIPLLSLLVRLLLVAIKLSLIAGIFYSAFLIYQSWPW